MCIRDRYWFFGTEKGSSLRATGANPNMARAQGINTNSNIVLGLMPVSYTHLDVYKRQAVPGAEQPAREQHEAVA